MIIGIIYTLVFFIFIFLIFMIIRAINSGIDGKNKNK
jgi:TM2 domain-containing membrane protein YozV